MFETDFNYMRTCVPAFLCGAEQLAVSKVVQGGVCSCFCLNLKQEKTQHSALIVPPSFCPRLQHVTGHVWVRRTNASTCCIRDKMKCSRRTERKSLIHNHERVSSHHTEDYTGSVNATADTQKHRRAQRDTQRSCHVSLTFSSRLEATVLEMLFTKRCLCKVQRFNFPPSGVSKWYYSISNMLMLAA